MLAGAASVSPSGTAGTIPGGTDLTGNYLGNAQFPAGLAGRVPRVVANPFNNTLLIQATPSEYDNILTLLKDLDIPPRQVLIEAKIYSVDLTHAFSSDVSAALQQITGGSAASSSTATPQSTAHSFLAGFGEGVTNLSGAALVGKSRMLLAAVQLQESESRAKVLSAPSVIATDSIPASIFVGTQVPVSTGTTNIPSAGGVVSSSGVSSENTGITLQVNARVNSSGVVTLMINQENSSVNGSASNANGTAFNQQTVQTQITMMDGDTIAIGGMIAETTTNSISGIPGLVNIPWIGWLFGTKSLQKDRSELIMFFTPHVIFDESQLIEASDELKNQVKLLKRDIRRQ